MAGPAFEDCSAFEYSVAFEYKDVRVDGDDGPIVEAFSARVPRRGLTAMVGPSGAGKTMIGLQFLADGARRREQGLYFGFFESFACEHLLSHFEGDDHQRVSATDTATKGLRRKVEVVWFNNTIAILIKIGP